MQKQTYEVMISSAKDVVWRNIIGDASYRVWTAPFAEGSYFAGVWGKGNRIHFCGPSADGTLSGMVSEIAEFVPYDFISIRHLGMIKNGVEDTTSEAVRGWAGSVFENYTLSEEAGVTKMSATLDVAEEWAGYMNEKWPLALAELKRISEA